VGTKLRTGTTLFSADPTGHTFDVLGGTITHDGSHLNGNGHSMVSGVFVVNTYFPR
jgi:hypothetical protein